MTPLASVVMAAYQAADTIGTALRSYTSQTVPDLEILVFDDGSSDDTAAAAHAVVDERIRVFRSERNVGRAAARDQLIRAAAAPCIVVADADDRAHPNRVAIHLTALGERSETVATFGRLRAMRRSGPVVDERFPATVHGVDASFRRGQMAVAHPASAFDRAWYLHTGGYDPQVAWAEDYDLFARGWRPGAFVPSPEVVLDYSVAGAARPWGYWWQNERHRRAVNARIAAVGRDSARRAAFGLHLRATSTIPFRAYEFARWTAVSVRDRTWSPRPSS